MTIEETADRFDNRTGYKLIAYGTVGLPLYRLTAVGLCLSKKSLDPIEEFILRSVVAGTSTVDDVVGLLGLEISIVESCLAELVRMECAKVLPDDVAGRWKIELTAKGRDVVRDQETTMPIEQTVVFCIDGLTRKPRFYSDENLYRPRELKDDGVPEIRAFPARPPELDEIDIKDVIEVVRLDAGRSESPRQLLRINSIERRDRVFLKAVALSYRSESGGTLQVAFAIDGRLSMEHEEAFAQAGGPEKTKVFRGLHERVVPPPMVDVLGGDLSRQVNHVVQSQENAEKLRRERVAQGRLDETRRSEVGGDLEHRRMQFEQLAVRPLAVYEHPPLLRRALKEAEERVLIISPWIRRAVVTPRFIETIRHALDRGVSVYVGYGLGDGKTGRVDEDARKELDALADEQKLFSFSRLGDTHVKILIKDREFFVISSFNWLSFEGDPNRTFREEWSTLVAIPSVVDKYFDRVVRRFAVEEDGVDN